MKKEKLTAFDKYLLEKNKSEDILYATKDSKGVEDNTQVSQDYITYIENQLRRTSPSEQKVLTEEEFLSTRSKRVQKVKATKSTVESQEETVSNGKSSAIQFKKSGKILLIGYVIIMLALALIVIVKTTMGDHVTNADAAGADSENQIARIQTMVEEDDSESENWFDRICDSLN